MQTIPNIVDEKPQPVPIQETQTSFTLPPILDNLDSVMIYKRSPCCSLFTNYVYEVCPDEHSKPILLIETPSWCSSIFLCRDRIFDLYSVTDNEKTKIGHYQLPCCYLPCFNFPLDCYIGPEKVGSVFHGFTCCLCGLPAYFARDANGNTEYVIEDNVCCPCFRDCCRPSSCCCCKETYVYPYKIHDKNINSPITGRYHVNYDVWNLICCRVECHPYFDVQFSSTTTRELKFAILGMCIDF